MQARDGGVPFQSSTAVVIVTVRVSVALKYPRCYRHVRIK